MSETPRAFARITTLAVTAATIRSRTEPNVPFDVLLSEEVVRLTVEWAASEICEDPFNAGAAAAWLRDQVSSWQTKS